MQSGSQIKRILLFAIMPFPFLLYALRSYRSVWFKNIVMLFIVHFSISFVYTESMDAYRYSESVKYYANKDTLADIFIEKSTYKDTDKMIEVFEPLVLYISTRLSDDSRLFYAFIGSIFGFFYSRNIDISLSSGKKNKYNLFELILVLLFAIIIPFWLVTGVRFWLAAHMVFYGFIQIQKGKKNGYLWMLCTPLIHYTFIYVMGFFLLFMIVGAKYRVFYLMYLIAFFFEGLEVGSLSDYISAISIPDELRYHVNSYANEVVATSSAMKLSDFNWYIRYNGFLLKWVVFILTSFVFFDRRSALFFENNFIQKNVFSFGLLFYSVTAIFSSVPSFGRFFSIANMMLMYVSIFYITNMVRYNGFFYWMRIAVIPMALFCIIITFWQGFDKMSMMTLIGNPISALFISNNESLITVVKSFIF